MTKRKTKKMSRELKAFLKKYGRFPKKGDLKRKRTCSGKRNHKSKSSKKGARRSCSSHWIF